MVKPYLHCVAKWAKCHSQFIYSFLWCEFVCTAHKPQSVVSHPLSPTTADHQIPTTADHQILRTPNYPDPRGAMSECRAGVPGERGGAAAAWRSLEERMTLKLLHSWKKGAAAFPLLSHPQQQHEQDMENWSTQSAPIPLFGGWCFVIWWMVLFSSGMRKITPMLSWVTQWYSLPMGGNYP